MMKQLLTLIAIAVSVSAIAFQARVDVNGSKAGINLKPADSSKGCTLSNPGWIKAQEVKSKQIYFASPKLTTKWQDVKFTFIPNKDGKVSFAIRGQWYNEKKGEKPKYVYFKKFEVIEGSTAKNPDFNKKNKDGNPASWWFNKKAKELPVFEEEDGETIVKLQFNNYLSQCIEVKKDQPVKIKATVKSAIPNPNTK